MNEGNNDQNLYTLENFATTIVFENGYNSNDDALRDIFTLASLYRAYWLSLSKAPDNTIGISTYFTSTTSNYIDLGFEEDIYHSERLRARIRAMENRIKQRIKQTKVDLPAIEVIFRSGFDEIETKVMILLIYASNFIETDVTVMELVSVLEAIGHKRSEILPRIDYESRLFIDGYIDFVKDDILDSNKKGFLKMKITLPDNIVRKIYMGRVHRTCEDNYAGPGKVITPRYGLDKIVLPPKTMEMLHLIIAQETNKRILYDEWGFRDIIGHDHNGIKILFHGPPGTGKSATAVAIAYELKRKLYVAEFTSIVDSYVGETAKNISKLFEIARKNNYVLLIDEADAISARRGRIKSGLDTEFNRDINVFLQETERFDGIMILTTNMVENLDPALSRRIHFKFKFDIPKEKEREKLWRLYIPKKMPLAEDVDIKKLAMRYRITGADIKMAVLNAARRALYRSHHSKTSVRNIKITMKDIIYALEHLSEGSTVLKPHSIKEPKQIPGGYV